MVQGRKPNSRKKGLKVLVYGGAGSGKTLFGLSFPKIKAIDSEDGYSWYEDGDDAKNILEIYDTQSFYDLKEVLEDLMDDSEVETLVIDSETKIHEDVQQALLDIDEKRARQKGKNVLDVNLSIRSYGKIKQLETALQNAKISLASRGVNIVSVAQMQDLTEEVGDKRIKVGEAPIMKKNANYDYDVVIKLYVENDKYYGVIEKDRTKTTKLGEVIENPTFDIWKKRVNGKGNQGETVIKDFVGDNQKSKEYYENELNEAEMTVKERLAKYIKTLTDKTAKAEFADALKKAGITSLSKLTDQQEKSALEVLKNFNK